MPWALLWKFRTYIGIGIFVISLLALGKKVMNDHDKEVAAQAIHVERMAELKVDSARIQTLIQGYNGIIDSLSKVNAKEDSIRTKVQEHKKKLAALQAMDESKVDSLVAQTRDSAVRVVIDSVSSEYKVVINRLKDQLIDADISYHSLELENKRNLSVIELKNTQMAALNDFNKKLHDDLLAKPIVCETHGESVGHFIIHKVIPVSYAIAGVVLTVKEIKK
jgi:hypothetical protein